MKWRESSHISLNHDYPYMLLYSMGNYIQYPMINHNEKNKRMYIYIYTHTHIYISESLCCTVEINTTL